MRTVLLLFVLLLSSCVKAPGSQSSCDPSTQTCIVRNAQLGSDDQDGVVPNEALTFETNLILENFSAEQEDKLHKAADLIKQIIATEKFKAAVLGFTFAGKKEFVDNGELTNLQIYYLILRGAEKLTPTENNAMDAELELYNEESNTVGYTNPDTRRIFMNTHYFNAYTPGQVAGNLMHEWLHKLGFGHALTLTPSRPYSVPYAIGYLITKLAFEAN